MIIDILALLFFAALDNGKKHKSYDYDKSRQDFIRDEVLFYGDDYKRKDNDR